MSTDTYTDPDGQKWRKTTGYNGYLKGADGRMRYDRHTGRGTRTVWTQVIEPLTCEECDEVISHDIHAKANHYRDRHDIDIFEREQREIQNRSNA